MVGFGGARVGCEGEPEVPARLLVILALGGQTAKVGVKQCWVGLERRLPLHRREQPRRTVRALGATAPCYNAAPPGEDPIAMRSGSIPEPHRTAPRSRSTLPKLLHAWGSRGARATARRQSDSASSSRSQSPIMIRVRPRFARPPRGYRALSAGRHAASRPLPPGGQHSRSVFARFTCAATNWGRSRIASR